MIVVPNYIETDCMVLKTDESWDEKQLLKFDEGGFQKLEKRTKSFCTKGIKVNLIHQINSVAQQICSSLISM